MTRAVRAVPGDGQGASLRVPCSCSEQLGGRGAHPLQALPHACAPRLLQLCHGLVWAVTINQLRVLPTPVAMWVPQHQPRQLRAPPAPVLVSAQCSRGFVPVSPGAETQLVWVTLPSPCARLGGRGHRPFAVCLVPGSSKYVKSICYMRSVVYAMHYICYTLYTI